LVGPKIEEKRVLGPCPIGQEGKFFFGMLFKICDFDIGVILHHSDSWDRWASAIFNERLRTLM
jgi:hypothetical protein